MLILTGKMFLRGGRMPFIDFEIWDVKKNAIYRVMELVDAGE